MPEITNCPGCGVALPAREGPVDPYGGSSPACWAMYGEVLAKDYSEYRYPAVHRVTTDAYLVQHPMGSTPAARRSLVTHLVGLCLVFDRKLKGPPIVAAFRNLVEGKPDFPALVRPKSLGEVTVADVHRAVGLEAHTARIEAWGQSVWDAWAGEHARVRAWADAALGL